MSEAIFVGTILTESGLIKIFVNDEGVFGDQECIIPLGEKYNYGSVKTSLKINKDGLFFTWAMVEKPKGPCVVEFLESADIFIKSPTGNAIQWPVSSELGGPEIIELLESVGLQWEESIEN